MICRETIKTIEMEIWDEYGKENVAKLGSRNLYWHDPLWYGDVSLVLVQLCTMTATIIIKHLLFRSMIWSVCVCVVCGHRWADSPQLSGLKRASSCHVARVFAWTLPTTASVGRHVTNRRAAKKPRPSPYIRQSIHSSHGVIASTWHHMDPHQITFPRHYAVHICSTIQYILRLEKISIDSYAQNVDLLSNVVA